MINKIFVTSIVFLYLCLIIFTNGYPKNENSDSDEELEDSSSPEDYFDGFEYAREDALGFTKRFCSCGSYKRDTEASSDNLSNPWVAQLVNTTSGKVFCSGVIINSRYVLTSATCLREERVTPSTTLVVLHHALNAKSLTALKKPTVLKTTLFKFPVKTINGKALVKNLALIQLASNVTFDSSIKPVCLPRNSTGVVANEGYCPIFPTQELEKYKELPVVPVDITSYNECYNPLTAMTPYAISQLVCVKSNIIPDCENIGGSPLFVKENNVHYLVAINTRATNTCKPDKYLSIYTRVYPYKNWIVSETTDDTTQFCSPTVRNELNSLQQSKSTLVIGANQDFSQYVTADMPSTIPERSNYENPLFDEEIDWK